MLKRSKTAICAIALVLFNSITFVYGQNIYNVSIPSSNLTSCNWNQQLISISSLVFSSPQVTIQFTLIDANNIPIIISNCSGGTAQQYLDATISGTNISNPVFTPGINKLTFDADFTQSLTVFGTLEIAIDCSVLENLNQNTSIKLEQIWSAPNSVFNLNGAPQPNYSNPINSPYLENDPLLQPSTFAASYSNNTTLEFYYTNTSSTPVTIDFQFNFEIASYCGYYDYSANPGDVYFIYNSNNPVPATPDGNYIVGSAWNTGTGNGGIYIPAGNTLLLRKIIGIDDCINPCTSQKVIFNWRCHDLDHTIFCDHCISDLETVFSLINQPSHLKISRLDPGGNPIPGLLLDWDNSGFSHANRTTFRYRVENIGTEKFDEISIEFTDDEQDLKNNLILLHAEDVSPPSGCSGCTVTPPANPPHRSNYSCPDPSGYGPAIKNYIATVQNLNGGDHVDITFDLYKCRETHSDLYNLEKYFNHWRFIAQGENVCELPITVVSGNGQPINSLSGFSISTHNSTPDNDMNLKRIFTPSIANYSLQQGNTSEHIPYIFKVDLQELFATSQNGYDEQVFGCDQSDIGPSCGYQGFLRIALKTETGLIMDDDVSNPNNDLSGLLMITRPGLPDWNPIWYNTSNLISECESSDYYFYFDMSSVVSAEPYFSGSQIEFSLVACCVALPSSEYTLEVDVMPDPANHITVGLPTSHDLEPVFASTSEPGFGNGAWIPLSQDIKSIDVMCPGCPKPGVSIKRYKMERISLGLPDADNDRLADNNTALVWSGYSPYATQYSNHGDKLLDRTVAQIENGSDYSFSDFNYDLMDPEKNHLDVLQFERIIPYGGPGKMKLMPVKFTFYVDEATAGNCLECELVDELYDADPLNPPNSLYSAGHNTIWKIEVLSSNITEWNKYVSAV